MLLAAAELLAGVLGFGWLRAPGVDLDIYLGATRRLLTGGSWFLERQLGGSYVLAMGDILYPPIAAVLFAPFLVVPVLVWWLVPLGTTIALVMRWKPTPIAWIGIALCLIWPYTTAKVLTGNPAMWTMTAVALAMEVGWVSALVLLKPSLIPFALIGVSDKRWWIAVATLGAASLFLAGETFRWFDVVIDAVGGGPFYSLVDVPLCVIPVLAWLGRQPRPNERASGALASASAVPST